MTSDGFVFEPDLARAGTLPSSWYRDPAVLDRELVRVFARTWQLVARTAELGEPGAYVAGVVGREPIVVCRGEDGALRAFSNVCRHRAGPVAHGTGVRRSFQCAYHGWTYGLDGRLLTTPEFDGVRDFDRSAHVYPDNLQTNLVVPLGPERTRVRFEWSVADPAAQDAAERVARALELGDAVQKEDATICEAVQRGLASATYRSGRYSVRRENGVHHFHGLVARSLAD